MLKSLLAIGNNPLVVILSSVFGAAAINYLGATLTEAFYWVIPVLMIIAADLITGVRAAKFRGESIRFSKGARRTVNKFFSYSCWIVTCVALNERYETELCAWVGMGIVFLIEGTSFLSNLLEPYGLNVSVKGLLKVLGGKLKVDNLEEVINDKQK